VHDVEVERELALDAPFGEVAVRGFLEQLGRVEQRLGRNAADVEAGAAKRLAASAQAVFSPSCAARIAAT
jgi:hypothetical protein